MHDTALLESCSVSLPLVPSERARQWLIASLTSRGRSINSFASLYTYSATPCCMGSADRTSLLLNDGYTLICLMTICQVQDVSVMHVRIDWMTRHVVSDLIANILSVLPRYGVLRTYRISYRSQPTEIIMMMIFAYMVVSS